MRLIDTKTLALKEFNSPEDVKPGYAILSHRWDGENELSFQDIQNIHIDDEARERRAKKVRKFCELASQQGYEWAWVDTCCIDKTSSAELSEAINSMFRYYSLSLVCYVYLHDVTFHDAFRNGAKTFDRSSWHTRGWTLQELIAPPVVLFFSDDWKPLGSKVDLAPRLRQITRIPEAVLCLEKRRVDFSIAQRMSWAASRSTTRQEDEAYSLLGIFDVNMPTLYGEGRKAFRRLQEEIMKKYPDTTLFAWGEPCAIGSLASSGSGRPQDRTGPFATSPSQFEHSSSIQYTPRASRTVRQLISNKDGAAAPRGDARMTFTATPHGVLAQIPIVEIGGNTYADLCWTLEGRTSTRLLLVLGRRLRSAADTLPIYDIGENHASSSGVYRIVTDSPGQASLLRLPSTQIAWKEVYLAYNPPTARRARTALYIPMNHTVSPPLRILEPPVARLAKVLQATDVQVTHAGLPWSGHPPATIVLHDCDLPSTSASASASASAVVAEARRVQIVLQFGRCTSTIPSGSEAVPHDAQPLWANVRDRDAGIHTPSSDHECPADHIRTWQNMERTFDLTETHGVSLSFTEASSANTLTLTDLSVQARTASIAIVILPTPPDSIPSSSQHGTASQLPNDSPQMSARTLRSSRKRVREERSPMRRSTRLKKHP
ncbi:hypothetical protein C8Q76DRAFT_471327 [Earliella scabrosa]|nr:hypothetical protein C8Q76DRAFT_471327 [Earliella scabrosa]